MNADNNDLIPMGAPASEFAVVMRGYERNQVNDAIGRLEDDLRTIVAERDQAVQRTNEAHQRAEALAGELEELKSEVGRAQAPSFETMGGRIASMLRLAEEESSDIRSEAAREAETTRAAAHEERQQVELQIASDRAEADQYIADLRDEADAILAKAKEEAAEHLDTHRKLAEETLSTAQAEAERLTADSEAHRKEAEEDFQITLAARRKESDQQEAERDQRSREESAARLQASRDEADAMLSTAHADAAAAVDEANSRARTIVAEAESEVNRLQKVRSALAQQIMQIGQLVSQVPAYLAKAPEDLPLDRDVEAPNAALPTAPGLYADGRTDDPPTETVTSQPSGGVDVLDEQIATRDADAASHPDAEQDAADEDHERHAPAVDGAEGQLEVSEEAGHLLGPADAATHDAAQSEQPEADQPADTGSDDATRSDGDGIVVVGRRGGGAAQSRQGQVSAIRHRRTKR